MRYDHCPRCDGQHTFSTDDLLHLLKLLEWQQTVIEEMGIWMEQRQPGFCRRCKVVATARKWCPECAAQIHRETVSARYHKLKKGAA